MSQRVPPCRCLLMLVRIRIVVLAAVTASPACAMELFGDFIVQPHKGAVRAVAASHDGQFLVSVGDDRMCYVTNVPLRRVVRAYGPHGAEATGVAINRRRDIFVSTKKDEHGESAIMAWDWETAKASVVSKTDRDIYELAISPDGTMLAAAFGDHTARVYTLLDGRKHGLIGIADAGPCTTVAFSPDGKLIAMGNGSKVLHFTLPPVVRPIGHNSFGSHVHSARYSADSKRLFVGLADGDSREQVVASEDELRPIFRSGRPAVAVAIDSKDGADRYFVGASRVRFLHDKRRSASFRNVAGNITALATSPAGDAVVIGAETGEVALWSPGGNLPKSAPPRLIDQADWDRAYANWLRDKGYFNNAATVFAHLLEQAVERREDDSTLLDLRRQLAGAQRGAAQWDEAIKTYSQIFQQTEKGVTKDILSPPRDAEELAMTIAEQGDRQRAERGLRTILTRRQQRCGPRHPAVADVHLALASMQFDDHQWERAIPHLELCIDIYRAVGDPARGRLARSLMMLGKCQFSIRQTYPAEKSLAEAVRLCVQLYGDNHSVTAEAKCRQAMLYGRSGRKESTTQFYRAFRDVAEYSDGITPSTVYLTTAGSTVLAFMNGEEIEREALVTGRNAMDYASRVHGLNHSAAIDSLSIHGNNLMPEGRLIEAEIVLKHALSLSLRRFGEHSIRTATVHHYLGQLYGFRGDWKNSEAHYRRAIEIHRANPHHPLAESSGTLSALAIVHAKCGRVSEAIELFDQYVRGKRSLLFAQMPTLPDQNKFVFAAVVFESVADSLSQAMHVGDDKAVAERSSEWVANLKGFSSEVIANRNIIGRTADDKRSQALLHELRQARQELMSLLHAREPDAERITQSQRREADLASQLGIVTRGALKSQRWVSLEEIRSTLAADTILVDFLRFEFTHPDTTEREEIYAAWVIPPTGGGEVKLVRLGNQKEIDKAIVEYRSQLGSSKVRGLKLLGESAPADERTKWKRFDEAERKLSEMLLGKMPRLAEYPRWLLSPDDRLWLVPWAGLRKAGGKCVLEDHEISYLVASRQLTWPAEQRPAATAPLLVGNPNYNHGSAASPSGRFAPLPGTARELAAVAPLTRQLADAKPTVLTEAAATEAKLKTVANPKILVFSTHGYVVSTQRQRDQPLQNPLLHCGLALAGANHAGQLKADDGNDGLLTGLEVAALDLRGTDLVVLSACETGLGRLNRGDGVSGLRQAFQIAGARSVVATLWSIPDDETADLMTAFFTALNKEGTTHASALRAAQLQMLADKNRHPYYWAAFGVTGLGR